MCFNTPLQSIRLSFKQRRTVWRFACPSFFFLRMLSSPQTSSIAFVHSPHPQRFFLLSVILNLSYSIHIVYIHICIIIITNYNVDFVAPFTARNRRSGWKEGERNERYIALCRLTDAVNYIANSWMASERSVSWFPLFMIALFYFDLDYITGGFACKRAGVHGRLCGCGWSVPRTLCAPFYTLSGGRIPVSMSICVECSS